MTIKKDSSQAINALFTFLNNLESVVLWMCNAESTKVLFLGENYDKLWQRSGDYLREHGLATWQDALVVDDCQRNAPEFYRRVDTPGASSMIYRIHKPDGEISHFKDTSYTLVDRDGNPTLMLGIAELLTPERWHEYYQQDVIEIPKHNILHDCIEVLQQEYKLLPHVPILTHELTLETSHNVMLDGETFAITPRETTCIYYLLKGCSAKETARQMKVSPRTVEFHLERLKQRFNCRTKTALLGKLQAAEIK